MQIETGEHRLMNATTQYALIRRMYVLPVWHSRQRRVVIRV